MLYDFFLLHQIVDFFYVMSFIIFIKHRFDVGAAFANREKRNCLIKQYIYEPASYLTRKEGHLTVEQ